MKKYLLRKKKMVGISTSLIALRQALGVLGAAINAFALTALVKMDIREFLYQELFLLLVWIIIIATEGFLKVYNIKIIQEIDIEIRKDIEFKFVNSDYEEFSSRNIGTYLSWLNNDIEKINQRGIEQYFEIVKGISGLIFSVIALIMYHWSLLLVTIISVFIMLTIPKIFKAKVECAGNISTKANEVFVNNTENILAGFSVFYNLSKLPLMVKQVVEESRKLKEAQIIQGKIESLVFVIGFFGNIFFQIVLTAYTGYLAYIGIVPIGTIEATGALNGVIFTSLGNFTSQISSINGVKPIFDKFERYKELDIDIQELDNKNFSEEVFRIRDLSFRYGDTKVFENLNYKFFRNKKYLLVGDSGSGKSTLLKLMFGYLTNYDGDIYFNKELINNTNYLNIREHVLYINQEPYLFNGTIRENINLDDNFLDEEIVSILNYLSYPLTKKDLDTIVGDRGYNLSGGQRQKIILARGLIRNQKIIFVDEGTSAIDRLSSIQIEKLLLNKKDLTLILVTHNPNEETKEMFDYHLKFPESFV